MAFWTSALPEPFPNQPGKHPVRLAHSLALGTVRQVVEFLNSDSQPGLPP